MAGTIPLSLTQQFDSSGNVLAGGKLYIIQAGTTSTPQNAYQDNALTLALPNPITLDASGRLPQFFLADGSIKIRLTDKNGVSQITQDGILVVGASSGGGGGSTVDPTTVMQTGQLAIWYGTGVRSGFVRANGRTIGSATSGASERANADTSSLYDFLWNVDTNLVVTTGRGASAAADFAANKQLTLPDFRGRTIAGLDDMGSSAAGRLTTYTMTSGTVLGAVGGYEKFPLTTANMPPYTPSGTNSGGAFPVRNYSGTTGFNDTTHVSLGNNAGSDAGTLALTVEPTFAGTPQGGTSAPVPTMPPTMLATIYLKL